MIHQLPGHVKEGMIMEKMTGAIMVQMIMRGMDELTDKNLRRLVNFLLVLLDEQEAMR